MIEGGIFHDDVAGGRGGVTLSVFGSIVRGTTPDGRMFDVDGRSATLTHGGDSGRMIFVRSADRATTLFSEDPAFLAAMRASSDGALAASATRLSLELQGSAQRGRRTLWLMLAGLAALVVSVVVGARWLGAHAVDLLPYSVDAQIGEIASKSMLTDASEVDDAEARAGLEKLMARIATVAASDVPPKSRDEVHFRVHLLQTDIVNAAALPGGVVLVNRGLAQRFLREGEAGQAALVGVLAHEAAHVLRRHTLRQLTGNLGAFTLLQAMFGDVSGIVVAVSAALFSQGYSRAMEAQADDDAAHTLLALGISPDALAHGFELLSRGVRENAAGPIPDDVKTDDGDEDDGGVGGLLSSHPDTPSRIEAMHAVTASSGKSTTTPEALAALGMDFARVRAAVLPAAVPAGDADATAQPTTAQPTTTKPTP